MKSFAVIGQGFVGGSLTTVFSEKGAKIFVYDKAGKVSPGGQDPRSILSCHKFVKSLPRYSTKEFAETCERTGSFSGIFFVCLPTPMRKNGSADLSIVEGTLDLLASDESERIAVLKSTVPPGSVMRWNQKYGSRLRIIFNPEFLTEANALNDMRNQNRIVLGGPRPWINQVRNLYQVFFSNVPVIKTSSTTAEMVKYVTNIHLATKVSLANEFYQICHALDERGLDIDYDKVIEYATRDERIGKSHWRVPGPMPADDTGEPSLGFGGSCFVKDIRALIYISKEIGVDPKVMEGVWEKNLEVRPGRDWERLAGRAVSEE